MNSFALILFRSFFHYILILKLGLSLIKCVIYYIPYYETWSKVSLGLKLMLSLWV
jgi:hypothetical protein